MSLGYLRAVALAVVVIAGAAVAAVVSTSLPPVSDSMEWKRDDVLAYGRPLADSSAARMFDPKGHAEIVAAVAKVEATPPGTPETATPIEASPSYVGMRIQDHRRDARTSRTVAIATLGIALFAGLLALLRAFVFAPPRRSPLVPIAIGVLVIAMLPGALLLWISSRLLGDGVEAFLLLAAFGLFVASNLAPGPAHPFIAEVEERLARATPGRRRAHLALRIVGGAALFLAGVVATAISASMGGSVMIVFTGAMAGGIVIMGSSVAVAIRGLVTRR